MAPSFYGSACPKQIAYSLPASGRAPNSSPVSGDSFKAGRAAVRWAAARPGWSKSFTSSGTGRNLEMRRHGSTREARMRRLGPKGSEQGRRGPSRRRTSQNGKKASAQPTVHVMPMWQPSSPQQAEPAVPLEASAAAAVVAGRGRPRMPKDPGSSTEGATVRRPLCCG